MMRGRFITLEGGEGAGKSTQVKRMVDSLAARGIRAIATREVGGAPGAEDIRSLWLSKPQGFWEPMTEVMLIMAARREHLSRTIWPALEAGVWVVSDRFIDSTRAYQGLAMGLGVEKIDAVYRQIADDFWPDLTLVLDLPVESGLQRMASRGGQADRYEKQDTAFHQSLRDAFMVLAKQEPARIKIVDASVGVDDVAAAIDERLKPLFGGI